MEPEIKAEKFPLTTRKNLDSKGHILLPNNMLSELGILRRGKILVVKYKDEDFIRIYKGE